MKARALFKKVVAMLMAALIALPVRAAEVITYFHNDVSGSPMLATNAAGAVLWKENYKPYGDKLNRQAASATNKIGFHGKPHDDNTGLSYMGARYYDPLIGRFTGIDPVDFDADNIHSFNRYAYANNNPYRYVDPDGRWAFLAVLVQWVMPGLIGGAALWGASNQGNTGTQDNRNAAQVDAGVPSRPAGVSITRSDSAGADSAGQPRAGESGGPGAGKDFGDKTKDEIRDRDGNVCVFCKRDTTRETGPDQSNIDHAQPKADGGNNTPNNGQNTCRTCNLDKGRRTTGEFQERGGRRLPPQYGGQP